MFTAFSSTRRRVLRLRTHTCSQTPLAVITSTEVTPGEGCQP